MSIDDFVFNDLHNDQIIAELFKDDIYIIIHQIKNDEKSVILDLEAAKKLHEWLGRAILLAK